jgi:hypothetical protein
MAALKIVAQFLQAPLASPPPPRAEPGELSVGPPPSQAEAIEAGRAVVEFLRGDDSVDLELAKQAQAIVSEFIAERERQMKSGHD